MEVIRIFFAFDLPLTLKEKIGALIQTLEKRCQHLPIRWSNPHNLHVTLQFLGQVNKNTLTEIYPALAKSLMNFPKVEDIAFTRLKLFPNSYRPRVIILDVSPQAALNDISNAIGQCLKEKQLEIENRLFHAHLTLGRIKQPALFDSKILTDVLVENFTMRGEEVCLFQSEPDIKGSKYTKLKTFSLKCQQTLS